MDTNRKTAVVAGVLFITATLADVTSRVALVQPILGTPVDLTRISTNDHQVLLGAVLLLIGAAAATGIAIALYPVLRLIEGALYFGIVVCVLLLVTLSHESANPGAPNSSAYDVPVALLMAARESLGEVAVLVFGTGAFMYYWVFYRSRLVPRWLSVWGLVAIASVMVSGLLVVVRLTEPMSTTQVVLALPIAVQEMVMAVWLIAKGFNPSALAAESAGETSRSQTAAPSTASAS